MLHYKCDPGVAIVSGQGRFSSEQDAGEQRHEDLYDCGSHAGVAHDDGCKRAGKTASRRPKTENGRKGYIVKWLGYSDQHNSWVPEEAVINLNDH